MGQETIPAWAQDTPAWAQDSAAPVRTAPSAGAPANAPSSPQADRDEDAKAILYQEFGPAQQRYNDAIASGNPEAIARAKGDLDSLTREIANKKGAVPTINTPTSGPARMAPSGDTAGAAGISDNDLVKRIGYGTAGALGTTLATSIGKMKAALAGKALQDKNPVDTQAISEAQASAKAAAAADAQAAAAAAAHQAAYEADVAKANKAYNDFMGAKEAGPTPTRGGSKGWLGGRMSPQAMALMPNSLLEGITTLTGQGPGSASNAEAQHTANMQRSIELGFDPRYSRLVNGVVVPYTQEELAAQAKNISDIQEAQRLADAQKQASIATKGRFAANIINQANTPASPPETSSVFAPPSTPSTLDNALGTFKNYGKRALEATENFAKDPRVRLGSTAFGVGAMAPELEQDLYGRNYKQAGLDVLKGGALGYGTSLLPRLVQQGLGTLAAPLAAYGNFSNSADRFNYDPTGAAISGLGGLASLAPLAPMALGSGPPGWAALGVGALGALTPGMINYIRDQNAGRNFYDDPRLLRAAREGPNSPEAAPALVTSGPSRMAH